MTSLPSATPPTAVFSLPLLTRSQNTYQRAHWLERHKLVGQFRRLIGHQLNELREHDDSLKTWPPLPQKRAAKASSCTAIGCMRCVVEIDERGQSWCEEHASLRIPPEKRRIAITRHGTKLLDYGNLVGGCKPLLDALVAEGVLYDDSPAWVEDHYQQTIAPKKEVGIVVEVWA